MLWDSVQTSVTVYSLCKIKSIHSSKEGNTWGNTWGKHVQLPLEPLRSTSWVESFAQIPCSSFGAILHRSHASDIASNFVVDPVFFLIFWSLEAMCFCGSQPWRLHAAAFRLMTAFHWPKKQLQRPASIYTEDIVLILYSCRHLNSTVSILTLQSWIQYPASCWVDFREIYYWKSVKFE